MLYTDGASRGNPGPGGWACILRYNGQHKEIFGSEKHTTNNRMELQAAVEGLGALKTRCQVEIITDSNYVKNGITQWIKNWKPASSNPNRRHVTRVTHGPRMLQIISLHDRP